MMMHIIPICNRPSCNRPSLTAVTTSPIYDPMSGLPLKCSTCDSREKGVFCDLSHEHLKELDQSKTPSQYKAHQAIFYEGNQPYGLYCVTKGKIKIYKTDANGNQQIMRLAGPGDILGYRCLLSAEAYSANAEALEDVTLCFIDKKSFFHILETHPKTALNVMQLLAGNLGNAEQQLFNTNHKNIRERMAELLLVFKNKYGEKTKTGIKLNIQLSRIEIAEMIGTTQESAIRLISDFKKDKLISVDGRDITLLDISALTIAANLID